MDIKDYPNGPTLKAMVILGSVLIVLVVITLIFVRINLTPYQPTTTYANIHLEKVELIENESEYVEIGNSDLEQYPLLAEVFDAWENPDKYENAYFKDNKTLIYDAIDSETGRLTRFIQGKLSQKYSKMVQPPYYLKYNQEFYSYQVTIE